AAIDHALSYGLVTLRPPNPRQSCPNGSNCDQNDHSLDVTSNVGSGCPNGNIVIRNGDIATNTNLTKSNNAQVCLDEATGYRVYYYDPYQNWTSPPTGFQVQSLVQDPNYAYPSRGGAAGTYTCGNLDSTCAAVDSAGCQSVIGSIPATYQVNKNGSL